MWLICIEVQWLSFGVEVVGYMIEAGYVIDEYQAQAERRYVVRIGLRAHVCCHLAGDCHSNVQHDCQPMNGKCSDVQRKREHTAHVTIASISSPA